MNSNYSLLYKTLIVEFELELELQLNKVCFANNADLFLLVKYLETAEATFK